MRWSRVHHGLTHLGERSLTKVRVSVQDYTGMACLKIWYPSSPFTPELKWFPTVDKAKAEGEQIMRRVTT